MDWFLYDNGLHHERVNHEIEFLHNSPVFNRFLSNVAVTLSLRVSHYRSSRLEMFSKIGFLENFAEFTGNTCASVSYFIKLQA